MTQFAFDQWIMSGMTIERDRLSSCYKFYFLGFILGIGFN
jgi:hypothetical protein